jgi:hypothetical protein
MGSDNPPQNSYYNNISQNTYIKSNNQNPNIYSNISNNYPVPTDNEKLNQIRRHSNFQNYPNPKNQNIIINPVNSSLSYKKQASAEIPPIFQRNQKRKLSAQYCANFKKSYMEKETNYTFLNHLADSINHGTQIPEEELEKFKKDYLPQYLLDWRSVQDQSGKKSWKNYGKIPRINAQVYLDKLGNNKIKSSEHFYLKRCWFYRYLMRNYAKNKNVNPVVEINRKNILEESYVAFNKEQFNFARPLKIKFINENNDVEGSYRDWYQNMFKDIMSPNKKLFLVNPYKSIEPFNILIYPKYPGMRMELYEFIGKFIIKSIVDMILIRNLIINKVHLKLITKNQITLEDIKYFNLDLYQRLKYVNDNKVLNNKQLESVRFIWNTGTNQEIELVQGGRNIFLNDQNKNIFINKVIYVEAIMPYEEQIRYIQKGLSSILGDGLQGVFTEEEMNFIITGQDDIDLRDLKENIIYKGEYNDNHPVIKMFWEKLLTLDKNELIKFLQFSTGSSAVPIDGFGSLKDIRGRIQKFTIEPFMNYSADNPDIYQFHAIESRKQYNTIILPKYKTKKELNDAINMIIANTN